MGYKVNPTAKQRAVAKKVVEGKSVSAAMREVGYSEATAKNPSKVTKSKGWNELLDEFLPDNFLATKHKELLNKKEYIAIGKKGEREVLSTGEIDGDAVARGLDLAYKLKGKYKPTMVELRSFVGWTPEELDNYARNGSVPERLLASGEGESRA